MSTNRTTPQLRPGRPQRRLAVPAQPSGPPNAFADRVGRSFDAQNAKIDRRIDGLAAQIDARIDRLDTRIDARIDGLDTRIDGLDTRIDKLDTKIDELETKIDTRIDTLETKIDARFATQDAKIDDLALKLTALIAALSKTEDVDAALAGEITTAPPAPDIRRQPPEPPWG